MAPSPARQEALDQGVTEGTQDPEERRVILDAQVYQDYQGPTLSKFHTECRRGMQKIRWLVVVIAVMPEVVKHTTGVHFSSSFFLKG